MIFLKKTFFMFWLFFILCCAISALAQITIQQASSFQLCTVTDFGGTCATNQTKLLLDVTAVPGSLPDETFQIDFGTGDLSGAPNVGTLYIFMSKLILVYTLTIQVSTQTGNNANPFLVPDQYACVYKDFQGVYIGCTDAACGGTALGCTTFHNNFGTTGFNDVLLGAQIYPGSGGCGCGVVESCSSNDYTTTASMVTTCTPPNCQGGSGNAMPPFQPNATSNVTFSASDGCGYILCGDCVAFGRGGANRDYMFWLPPAWAAYLVPPNPPKYLFEVTFIIDFGTALNETLVLNSFLNPSGFVVNTNTNMQARLSGPPVSATGQVGQNGYGRILLNTQSYSGAVCFDDPESKPVAKQFKNPFQSGNPLSTDWLWLDSNKPAENLVGDQCNSLGYTTITYLHESGNFPNICNQKHCACVPGVDPNVISNQVIPPNALANNVATTPSSQIGIIDGKPAFCFRNEANNMWCHQNHLLCDLAGIDAGDGSGILNLDITAPIHFEIKGTLLQVTQQISPGEFVGSQFCTGVVNTDTGTMTFSVKNTGSITASYTIRVNCTDPAYTFAPSQTSLSIEQGATKAGSFSFATARPSGQPGQNTCILTLFNAQGTLLDQSNINCNETLAATGVPPPGGTGAPSTGGCGLFVFKCKGKTNNKFIFLIFGILLFCSSLAAGSIFLAWRFGLFKNLGGTQSMGSEMGNNQLPPSTPTSKTFTTGAFSSHSTDTVTLNLNRNLSALTSKNNSNNNINNRKYGVRKR